MTRGKGNHPKRSKPPKPPKNAAGGGGGAESSTTGSTDDLRQEQSKTEPLECTSSAAIKMELKPAQIAANLGRNKEALGIIQAVCIRHRSSPFVHRFLSSFYLKMASQLDGKDVRKQQIIKNAIESAKRAVWLAPDSISYALFYATTLYSVSTDEKDYEEVMEECERALSIPNPTDTDEDTSIEESHDINRNTTFEERIESIKQDLQKLIEVSKIASVDVRKKVQEPEKRSRLSRLQKRRKDANVKNFDSLASRIEQLQSYFKPMSDEEKLRLLETRICDLRAHLSSFKDRLAEEILSEAVGFNEKNNTWKFWACCCCGEKFADSASHLHHFKQQHIGNLSLELQSVVPVEADAHWAEMLVNGPWKPVDTTAAVGIIESQSKCKQCPSESSSNPVTLPSWPVLCSDDQKWPISDDSARAEILEKVHDMLQLILKYSSDAESHINGIMHYTMELIQECVPTSQLLIQRLYQSPLGFCFLGVSQLKKLLQFLEEILKDTLGLESSTDDDDDDEIHERIVLCGDSSRLLQDELLLRVDLMPNSIDYSAADDVFLNWLYVSVPTDERSASWTCLCEHTKAQGMELFKVLEEESHLLQSLCKKKCENMSCQEALELDKIDAKITRSIAEMKQLEIKLTRVSAYDYRAIMLLLLRSFMRAHLEDLFEKDATKKAEAAGEALLTELELDAEKNINKGGNQTKHTQGKSKNIKKKKDQRKLKEGKVSEGNKQHIPQEHDGEQRQIPVTHDGDCSNPDLDISESANTLKEREELDRIELETVARKLEENLEFQRQLESKAKQKQFSMQNEKTVETITFGTLTVPILQDTPQAPKENIERAKKSHEKLVNVEAKEKEKEQLSKVIQERMDRIKELDKYTQESHEELVNIEAKKKEKEQLNKEIQELDKEIEKSHEKMVNLGAKEKEKEQLNKEIQESMDRIKTLEKEIQSLH